MASINGRGDHHGSPEGVRGELPAQSTNRAGDRQMMDDMGSEVFNLKLAVQEYEDRLAKLYQTEDRSLWRGSASLLNDLEAADRDVDRLEDTVADLQRKLIAARGARVGGHEGIAGTGRGNPMSSLDSEEELDHQTAYVAELQEQITELEEDNRVLMEASGWERCELSEGEEEDEMVVPRGRSRRLKAIDVLSDKIKELHGLVALAEEREEAATSAAEEACAELDDAAAKIEELQAAADLYKNGKAIAEESLDALRSEMEQRLSAQRAEEGAVSRAPTATPMTTRAAGFNTEPCTPAGEVELPVEVRDRLTRLEADVQLWREACSAANDELKEEKNLGGDTTRRLAEKEASVRELTARLREKVAIPAGRSMECGQRRGQLSGEVSVSKSGSKGKHGSRESSCCSHDSPSESTSTLADAAWKAVGASPGTHVGGGRRAKGVGVRVSSSSVVEEITPAETAAASTVETGDGWVAEQGLGARQHGVAAAVRQDTEASGAGYSGIHSRADTSEGSSMLASSSSASEVGWVGGGGSDGRDEPSTAECSTETLGGGADVSFSIESGEEVEEAEGDAAAVLVSEVSETGHRRQRQGQRQDRQRHRQRRTSSVGESATGVLPPSPLAEQGVKKVASSTLATRPRNRGDYCAPAAANKRPVTSGLTPVPVCFQAVVDDRVVVRQAQVAAHRAEVSAQRAECSAENARSDRLAAELAAAEAGATAAAQRAASSAGNSRAHRLAAELAASKARTTTAAMRVEMAPSHGSFVGVDQQVSSRVRRPPSALQSRIPLTADSKAVAAATAPARLSAKTAVPLAVAPIQNSTDEQSFSTTTSQSRSELRDGEDDGDRRARRAARLAERASVAARLELLSAAAARERSAGSFSSSTEELIHRAAHGGGHGISPGARWRGRQYFGGSEADRSSLASEEGFRRRDGHGQGYSARQDASERDGDNSELSRVAAAVAAAAAAAAKNGFISVAGGNNTGQVGSGQASSSAGDYWQQPVLAAAEAASAMGGDESHLYSSVAASKSPSLTGSEKYSPRREVVASGRAVAVKRTHAHRGGSGAQSGLRTTEFSPRPATTNTTRTAHGKQVAGTAVKASTQARRALEEVGAGRSGALDKPRRDSLGYILHKEQESGAYERGFDFVDPFGRDFSGSGPGSAGYDGNKAASGATVGSRAGGRPQKKPRRKTPAPPAPDRSVFRHAHGGPCARSCACSSCPCSDAAPGISSSWHLRRRRPATAGVR